MTRRKYLFYFILFLTACGGGDGGSNLGSQQNAAPEFIGLTEYVIDENTSTVTTIKATIPLIIAIHYHYRRIAHIHLQIPLLPQSPERHISRL